MKIKFQYSQIKSYWNRAVLVHLYVVFGSFQDARTELNSCGRDSVAHRMENIYYLALQEMFANPCSSLLT